MGGLFKFFGDILKPILTLVVTVFLGAFLVSVFSPRADSWITSHVPAWERLDPAIEQVRDWLGMDEPDPWWMFWGDD